MIIIIIKQKTKKKKTLLKYNIIGGFLSEALPAPVHTITLAELLNPLCFSAEHVDANHGGRALIRWGRVAISIIYIFIFFYVIKGPDESRKMWYHVEILLIFFARFDGTTEIDKRLNRSLNNLLNSGASQSLWYNITNVRRASSVWFVWSFEMCLASDRAQ